MRLRKMLAMLLALSMFVSMAPVTAFAQETGDSTDHAGENVPVLDNLFLDKSAVLADDGTYTINLEAYATGTTITKTITEGVPHIRPPCESQVQVRQ